MESKLFLMISCFVVVFMVTLSSSEARSFNVGDNDGWVVNPRESFNHWAERNRFQIHDTAVFKYRKGSDSVLVVTEDSYDSCNVTDPLQRFTDGNSKFTFGRSGPFFFISGDVEHCGRGQKLIVVVLSPRQKAAAAATPPATTPSPMAVSPAAVGWASPAPSPAPAGGSSAAAGFGSSVGLVFGLTGGAVSLVLATSFFGFALV
ncbi:hypothetical protein Dimus_009559 [Dionaea muscipula]